VGRKVGRRVGRRLVEKFGVNEGLFLKPPGKALP